MADVEIPRETLEALERDEADAPEAAIPRPEGMSEQELLEYAAAANHDEMEGLPEALPYEPDPADLELPEEEDEDAVLEAILADDGGSATAEEAPAHTDESSKLFIGKQFTLPQFAKWFAAQNLGSLPYNGIGIHHTWRPRGREFVGTKTVKSIFDWYARPKPDGLGWTRGKGPHFWLYGGDNPDYHPGKILVVVGTHPRHDGIHIKYWNHRTVGIECFGDFDAQRMPEGCVKGYRILLQLLSKRRGQPVKINHGPSIDGPAAWQGGLFHRERPRNPKSCPGNTTTHDWFDAAMTD